MKTQRIIYAMVAIIAGFLILHVDAQTIEPLYDMYTDPDHSGTHPVTELWVADYDPMNNHQRIMIMFDISPYIGQTVDSAFLNIDRFFGCPQNPTTHTKMYEITETWNESWPENVHISHGTTVWTSYTFNYNGWHRVDITSLVNAWLNGTVTNYGLVIRALAGNKFSKFYSREASSSVRPYLELVGLSGIEEETDNTTVSHTLNIAVFPNPFYSVCNMTVPEGSTVEIFGMDGRRIYKVRSNGSKLIWKPLESVGSGIYFIRTTLGKQTATRKITCLKN